MTEIEKQELREALVGQRKNVLADVYKLLQIQEDVEDVYIVTPEQKKAIKAAQNQIKKGLTLKNGNQANTFIQRNQIHGLGFTITFYRPYSNLCTHASYRNGKRS